MTSSLENAKQYSRFYPWLIWSLGAGFFFAEYFGRVAPSVMVPELMQVFGVTALSLGALSAFFYYAYVGMQIPVGTLIDRFGPHRLLTVTAGLCAVGCIVFAHATNLMMAELGRFLMGLGASFAFVGTLKLTVLWFDTKRFGLLAGLTQALGMLGAAVGEGPLAFVVGKVGWQQTMDIIGIILFAVALLIGIVVQDNPQRPGQMLLATKVKLIDSLKRVLRNPQSWLNAAYAGLLYAPTAAFAELWGVQYLVHVYGISVQQAANAISMIFVGWAVGGPVAGWLSDRVGKRRPIMFSSALLSLLVIGFILYGPHTHQMWVLCSLLFLYGVVNTGLASSYAVAGEINPKPVAGTSFAFANMASVLVGAAFQPIIGALLDMHWDGAKVNGVPIYTAMDFRMAMVALPLCLVLALLFAGLVKETHCRVSEELMN